MARIMGEITAIWKFQRYQLGSFWSEKFFSYMDGTFHWTLFDDLSINMKELSLGVSSPPPLLGLRGFGF